MNDEKVEIKKDSSGGLLWHFTSVDALPKILLGDDGLLAGNTLFMDDPYDCQLSRNIVKIVVQLLEALRTGNSYNGVQNNPGIKRWLNSGAAMPTFVTCFTNAVNDSKMWQFRAKQDCVAIGFDPAIRRYFRKCPDKVFNVSFKKCDYISYDAVSNQIDNIYEKVSKRILPYAGIMNSSTRSAISQVVDDLLDVAKKLVFVKKKSYRWEKESRAAFILSDADLLRSRLRFIDGKPYVRALDPTIFRRLVKSIRISPFGDVARVSSISYLIGKAVGLVPSQIEPYELK